MPNNKKLSIIISSYDDLKNPVYGGGGAQAVHQLAAKLGQKYNVTVITGAYNNSKNVIFNNIKYERIGTDRLGHKIGQIIYQIAILRYVRKTEYDLWIEGSTPPFTFSLLPLFSRKPVISWVHMICSYDMKRKYYINFRFIEKKLCNLYHYIIVPTSWVRKEIENMNNHALIKNIPNGYEIGSYPTIQTKNLPKYKYLLYLGRIEVNQKGIDLLLEALSLIDSSIKIIIAGSGDKKETNKLNDLIYKYNVQDKIKLVGRIVGSQKENLLRNALAIIIPSRYETLVTVAIEAIIHKKPVICFNIPQNEWIPGKYAFKVKPFNVIALSKIIDTINKNYKNKRITEKDKDMFLKNFSWNNFVNIIDSMISKIAI